MIMILRITTCLLLSLFLADKIHEAYLGATARAASDTRELERKRREECLRQKFGDRLNSRACNAV